MLLNIHKTGIRIMELGFFYMPKFIVKYDIKNTIIILNNTKFTLICFAITTAFILNIGLGSLFVALTYFFGARENLNLTHAIIQSINAAMSLVTVLAIVLGYPQRNKLPLFNHLLSQCQLIFRGNLAI